MKVTQNSRTVLTVLFDDVKSGWEQRILLRSDAHHDNKHCNHSVERRHLQEAKETGAWVLDAGDQFCAMQGKWDRRADEAQMRPELRGGNYLDRLVKYNSEFIEPYADRFLMFGLGNHETSILKHHQTNLTERMVERLNLKQRKHKIHCCGFTGYVRFKFRCNGTEQHSRNLFFHHGYGGGGPVTRGVIQSNRMAVYLPDADIVWSGHTHDEWVVPIARSRLSAAGEQYQDEQIHVKTPGYKDEYDDGHGGWHIERGAPPKPIGAVWLVFKYRNHKIEVDWSRAK